MKIRTILLVAMLTMAMALKAQFTTTPERLKEHVYILASDSLRGRGFGTPHGLEAAQYIAAQFEEAGIEPLGDNYLHPFNFRTGILNIQGNNVVGVIRSDHPELREEYIILGAHYDHLGWKIDNGDTIVYNGADDNATGSSSIIEIGKNLRAGRSGLGRSVILVAFDGEESGLIGSKQFVDDSIVPLHQIKLMFGLDMVGMAEAHKGVDLIGIGLLHDAKYLTGDLADKYNLKIRKSGSRIERRADTAPFGKIGIPAIAVYTGSGPAYHKPEDTAEKLDYDGMARIANYMTDATLRLSNAMLISEMKGPVEGEVVSEVVKTIRPGFRFNAGSSVHNYRDRYYKGKSVIAASAGILANIRLSGILNIQPEVLFETKGSEVVDGTFRTYSMTTPLNFMIYTPGDYIRSYFLLGGYFSYHFGGNISGMAIDFNTEYQNHEMGFTVGAGFEVMDNMQMGIYFQTGLSDLNQLPNDRISHENLYFSIAYIF